jgi:His-Xaa-Ser system protein HxsD
MTTPEGFPEGLAVRSPDDSSVSLEVDERLYPIDAIYGAAYIFIDRCYVLLDQPSPGRFRVTLTAKDLDAGAERARALIGEFANELLGCAWRQRIIEQNRAAVEATSLQAIAGAMGPPSLDDLEAFDFGKAPPLEDPLGISMSWEEKYKKKGPGGAKAGEDGAKASDGGEQS